MSLNETKYEKGNKKTNKNNRKYEKKHLVAHDWHISLPSPGLSFNPSHHLVLTKVYRA